MACVFLFVFFFLSHLVLLYSAEEVEIYPTGCPTFVCGKVGKIGLLILHDCGDPHQMKTPKIKLERNGTLLYDVETVFQANTIQIKDPQLQSLLDSNGCESLKNWTLRSPSSLFNEPQLTRSCCSNATTLSIFLPLHVLIEQIAVTMTSIIVLHIIIYASLHLNC